MTEEDWLTAIEPLSMIDFIGDRVSEHQMAIAAVELSRADKSLMSRTSDRTAVDWAEKLIRREVDHEDSSGPDAADCYLMSAAANRCLAVALAANRGPKEEAHEMLTEMVQILADRADPAGLAHMAAECRRIFSSPFSG